MNLFKELFAYPVYENNSTSHEQWSVTELTMLLLSNFYKEQ